MKYIKLLLLFVFISCISSKSFVSPDNSRLYKIERIKNNKYEYIIYAHRNDSTFKIVSYKDTINSNCEKIKVGGEYNLMIKQIYPQDSLFGYALVGDILRIKPSSKDGKIIQPEKKSHYKIYMALNLEGLCLINNDSIPRSKLIKSYGSSQKR